MPRINRVDVNVKAFAGYKSLADLEKEPGQIFAHLGPEAASAAYAQLWALIAPAPTAVPKAAPVVAADVKPTPQAVNNG